MIRLFRRFLLAFLTIGLLPQMAAFADEAVDENARKCISYRTIKSTTIIDDRNIIFYSRGKRAFHNILPKPCRGLAREDRFSYHISAGQLCDLDLISVLHDDGLGLREGNSCRLGMFIPITKEDADALTDTSAKEPEPAPIPLPQPEEIGVEQDAEPTSG